MAVNALPNAAANFDARFAAAQKTLVRANALPVTVWIREFYTASSRVLSLAGWYPQPPQSEPAMLYFRNPRFVRLPHNMEPGGFRLGSAFDARPFLVGSGGEAEDAPLIALVQTHGPNRPGCIVCDDALLFLHRTPYQQGAGP